MINKTILKKGNASGFSNHDLYKAYKLFFNTFASEHRLKILNLLRKKSMNVTEIQKETSYEQTVISHNLSRLLTCGFVKQQVKGRYRYYRLNNKTITPILTLIDKHMQDHCLLIVKKIRGEV